MNHKLTLLILILFTFKCTQSEVSFLVNKVARKIQRCLVDSCHDVTPSRVFSSLARQTKSALI
jgi:hypothetical protein